MQGRWNLLWENVEGRDPHRELEQPGDYVLVTEAPYAHDGRPSVYFIVPEPLRPLIDDPDADRIKSLASVAMPPHVFRECADGSLEIRESILVTQRWKGSESSWHGYLDEGHIWRKA